MATALALCGGCGPRPRPPTTDNVPRAAHAALAARAFEGDWFWHHVSEVEGVRRVELEWWTFEPAGDGRLRASYDRKVHYLSIDGRPFTCSQTPSYQTRVRYELEGAIEGDAAVLVESAYEAAPSACDRGYRKLGHYRATLEGEGLRLSWDSQVQRLSRQEKVPPSGWPQPSELSVDGTFEWSAREQDANRLTTVQRERWQLRETDGVITGHYEHIVDVYAEDGHFLPCAQGSAYRYRDTFEVSGSRSDNSANIVEVDVIAGTHPCLGESTRHLDTATVTITPSHLEFEWRGRRRQVLSRITAPGQ